MVTGGDLVQIHIVAEDQLAAEHPAWTLGGNQVGKAAISGWRELLAPARRAGIDVGRWPFDGALAALLSTRRFVVAETYPGEVYEHLGLRPVFRSRVLALRRLVGDHCA